MIHTEVAWICGKKGQCRLCGARLVEKGAAPVSRTYVQKGEREGGSGGMN